ncbi:hypothetical protein ACP4OV_013096 [Aristida adscensionis]
MQLRGARGDGAAARHGTDGDDLLSDVLPSPPRSHQVTANFLFSSKQTIPHYLTVYARVDDLVNMLQGELNPLQDTSGGKKISINNLGNGIKYWICLYFICRLQILLFQKSLSKDADKGLGTMAEVVKQLAQKARDNSLKPADYKVYVLSRKVEMRSSWNRVIPFS